MVEGISSPIIDAIGWSLVEFAWQGTLVAAVTALVLLAISKSDARTRYVASCLAMLVMVALPVRTAVVTYAASATSKVRIGAETEPRTGAIEAGGAVGVHSAARAETLPDPSWGMPDLESWLPGIVLAWLVGVLALSVRMAGGWLLVGRMRRRGRLADIRVLDLVRRTGATLAMARPVRALESSIVMVPTVVGWLRPVILLPAAAVTGLTPEQLQAVVAHELAHVRRQDYLVNLLQTFAETLLFYHPGVWWISNRIRAERENAADDLAVAACGDPVVYAQALSKLEATRTGTEFSLALGATGGPLVDRIRRVLGQPRRHRPTGAGLAVSATATALFFVVMASQTSAVPTPPEQETPDAIAGIEREPEPAPVPALEPVLPEVEPEPVPAPSARRAPESVVARELQDPPEPAPVVVEVPGQAGSRIVSPGFTYQDGVRTFGEGIATLGRGRVSSSSTWMGVQIEDGPDRGVVVQAVEAGSPAANAGIRDGDLITSFAGTPVVGAVQFQRLVSETPSGREVALRLTRNGQEQDVEVTLASRPIPVQTLNFTVPRAAGTSLDALNTLVLLGRGTALGIDVDAMTPELREFFGAEPEAGILVVSMDEDAAGRRAGLQVGDVIIAVDGNTVDSAQDLRDLSRAVLGTGNSITVTIMRDRSEREIVVEPEASPER